MCISVCVYAHINYLFSGLFNISLFQVHTTVVGNITIVSRNETITFKRITISLRSIIVNFCIELLQEYEIDRNELKLGMLSSYHNVNYF